MSVRTVFTTISPLPANISREIVLDFLHDHQEMIDLNPLVKERHPIPAPPHAPPDEVQCVWYSLTDKISYLPGITGDVTYTCAFNDLSNGLQTHCFAPAGLTIRDKWTLQGRLPDEPPQPIELGLGAPEVGLYIREDVDMRCNMFLSTFVKRTLKRSHATLIERLKTKAAIATQNKSFSSWDSTMAEDSLSAIGGLSLVTSHESTSSSGGRKRAGSSAGSSIASSKGRVPSWKNNQPASKGASALVAKPAETGLGVVSQQTWQFYEQLGRLSQSPRYSPQLDQWFTPSPPPQQKHFAYYPGHIVGEDKTAGMVPGPLRGWQGCARQGPSTNATLSGPFVAELE